mgnify:FL=1
MIFISLIHWIVRIFMRVVRNNRWNLMGIGNGILKLSVETTAAPAPTTAPASTTPGVTRTTSEGEIVPSTLPPATTTTSEVCATVEGMSDPSYLPNSFIEVR